MNSNNYYKKSQNSNNIVVINEDFFNLQYPIDFNISKDWPTTIILHNLRNFLGFFSDFPILNIIIPSLSV